VEAAWHAAKFHPLTSLSAEKKDTPQNRLHRSTIMLRIAHSTHLDNCAPEPAWLEIRNGKASL
jgi:hypothetical protein